MSRAQTVVSAILTLSVFSYLWKENAAFRFTEHTFVGLAVGHGITLSWHQAFKVYHQTYVVEQGYWWFMLLLPIGALYYFRFFFDGKYGWLASYPISITMGWGMGYTLARGYRSTLVQLADTMVSLRDMEKILFFVIWMCAMMYFFFTVGKESKIVATCGKLGRYFMILAFGTAFGNTINGRISLFLGRLSFLLTDFLGIK